MPKRSARKPAEASQPALGLEVAFNRIANLLALLLVRGESETQKALTLTAVGYSPAEIAQLLGKQANTVSVILYKAKREARARAKS